MAHVIEEDSGTIVPRVPHPHNGYYAGDFSAVPFQQPDLRCLPGYALPATRRPVHDLTVTARRAA
jgi:hypothetical protein